MIPVNIGAGDQFKSEFLKITANHRIPAIVDSDGPGGKPFTLFPQAGTLTARLRLETIAVAKGATKLSGRRLKSDPPPDVLCRVLQLVALALIFP